MVGNPFVPRLDEFSGQRTGRHCWERLLEARSSLTDDDSKAASDGKEPYDAAREMRTIDPKLTSRLTAIWQVKVSAAFEGIPRRHQKQNARGTTGRFCACSPIRHGDTHEKLDESFALPVLL